MHNCYGLRNSNTLEARRIYLQKFPNTVIPGRVHRHILRENVYAFGGFNGSFYPPNFDRRRARTVRTVNVEEENLHEIDQKPTFDLSR